MDRYSDQHSAWRFQYSHPIKTATKTRRFFLISWMGDLIFFFGTFLFAYQIYGWVGRDEWTRYPAIALVKYLPAGCLNFLNKSVAVKDFLLWLLERADISVLLVLIGFLVTRLFVDSE